MFVWCLHFYYIILYVLVILIGAFKYVHPSIQDNKDKCKLYPNLIFYKQLQKDYYRIYLLLNYF